MLKTTNSCGRMLVNLRDIKHTSKFCNKFSFNLWKCELANFNFNSGGVVGEGSNVQSVSQTGLDQLINIILLPSDYPGLSSSKSKQNIEIAWRDINKITNSCTGKEK